jgi:tetratricopeptide (TPR) repeat protein
MRCYAALILLAAGPLVAQQPADWRDWLNLGVSDFKNARYAEAVANFQKAVELNPTHPVPHLYLASAYMQQYIPGAESPQNSGIWQQALSEFQSVLGLDPTNKVALSSIASLNLNAKRWDAARDDYRRLATLDPNNAQAYYSLAFIDWSQWYPAYAEARRNLAMKPEQPGPIADAAVKASLRARWSAVLDDGIWNLNHALELNPTYDDAMAYMNLFIRERADLKDTQQEYAEEIRVADQWVTKTLETKRAKAERRISTGGGVGGAIVAPPPPPPPPGQ